MSSQPDSPTRPTLSLDELILLNDEICALLRARIPLDVGLRGSSSRIAGRLGRLTERLAGRLEAGASLEEALAAERGLVSSSYRAVLVAGIRSGRFDDVLRSMSEFAAAMRDLREHVSRALIYPAAVVTIAYGLFVGIVVLVVPHLLRTFESFNISGSWWAEMLGRLHEHVELWGPAVPLVAAAVLLAPWLLSFLQRSLAGDAATTPFRLGVLHYVPGVGRILRDSQLARFAHLLGLLTSFRVPLNDALRLSAASTGEAAMIDAAEATALRIEAGSSLGDALPKRSVWPPFFCWLMVTGERQAAFSQTLLQAAETYRQRAVLRAEWVQRLFPVAMVLLFGGGITIFYALSVFVPMSVLWQRLGG